MVAGSHVFSSSEGAPVLSADCLMKGTFVSQ